MRHAILGAGGVGGLIGVALATSGESVTVVLRAEALESYPPELWLESPLGSFTARVERTAKVITNDAIARCVPCGRVFGNGVDESFHFLHPASGEHCIESGFDPVDEHRPRVDDKIASRTPCGTGSRTMQRTQTVAAQDRHFDRPKQLCATEVGAIGIER